jgi:hypothetical protein
MPNVIAILEDKLGFYGRMIPRLRCPIALKNLRAGRRYQVSLFHCRRTVKIRASRRSSCMVAAVARGVYVAAVREKGLWDHALEPCKRNPAKGGEILTTRGEIVDVDSGFLRCAPCAQTMKRSNEL